MNKVTPQRAAKELGVTTDALRRWAEEGKITVERTAGGHRRYDLDELIAVLGGAKAAELDVVTVSALDSPEAGVIPLGTINRGDGKGELVGIQNEALSEHLFYCGRTGAGKSELMLRMITGMAKTDYPLVLIDPHGVLSDDIVNALITQCPERADDIVLCDLGDPDHPVSFNPLAVDSADEIEGVVGAALAMFERQMNFSRSSAPRATNYLYLALTALAEANLHLPEEETKFNLLHVTSFFLDWEFRQLVVSFSENVAVREMFSLDRGPYEQKQPKQQMEEIGPILRAMQELSRSGAFSSVFGSGKNRLNLARLINERKIVLIKLARFHTQQKLGEFIGSLILPYLLNTMAKWGKSRDPETGELTGVGCRLFIDEAPRLLGPDSPVEQILAEARKWDLGVVMCSQHLTQFDLAVMNGILATTASKAAFVLDPASARLMAQALQVPAEEIVELARYHFLGRLLVDEGEGGRRMSRAVEVRSLPPVERVLSDEGKTAREQVVKRSRLILTRVQDEEDEDPLRVKHLKTVMTLMQADKITAAPVETIDDLLGLSDDDGMFRAPETAVDVPAHVVLAKEPLKRSVSLDWELEAAEARVLEALYRWHLAEGMTVGVSLIKAAETMEDIGAKGELTGEILDALDYSSEKSRKTWWAVAESRPSAAGLIGQLVIDLED
jgi:excisionase family DNA binding protein